MIRAQELRIGNLIYAQDMKTILKVNYFQHSHSVNGFPEDILSGIPLTEEWLLKFGLLKLGDGFEFWDSSVFNIESIRNHWHICYTSNILCTIKYIHQLQNLYFALTGIELEIKETVPV